MEGRTAALKLWDEGEEDTEPWDAGEQPWSHGMQSPGAGALG